MLQSEQMKEHKLKIQSGSNTAAITMLENDVQSDINQINGDDILQE